MSHLLILRQKKNLTQEELSAMSGVSVRTIQRIETGIDPKGYSLKALAKALDVEESGLRNMDLDISSAEATKWMKIINISSILFMFLPPLNIIFPLFLMFTQKQFNDICKKILTLQFLWTIIAVVWFSAVLMLNDWFSVPSQVTMLIPIAWLLANALLTILNAIEISRSKRLKIDPGFSII